MEFKEGTSVGIKFDCNQYGGRLNGRCGVVAFSYNSADPKFEKVAVLVDGMLNPSSMHGCYYFWPSNLHKFDNKPYCEKPKDSYTPFAIKNAYFNAPVTVVMWEDGTKTIVRCGENDDYDPEKGLAMAYAKKALGNKGNYYKQFKKWLPKVKCCYSCKHRDKYILQQPCFTCSALGGHRCYEPIGTKK